MLRSCGGKYLEKVDSFRKLFPSAGAINEAVRFAREHPVSGWDFAEWLDTDANEASQSNFAHLIPFAARINQELELNGFAVIGLAELLDTYAEAEAASSTTLVLSLLGQPLRVFLARTHWRRLGVDVTRHPARSEGIGYQSFHIDFVNAEDPPDLVCLLCVRPDPLGGGASLISEIAGIEALLPEQDIEVLRQSLYSDGVVDNLNGIGQDVNPFPVLAPGMHWQYRYTASLLNQTRDARADDALHKVQDQLETRSVALPLSRGDLLILDQHRMTHGRGALGQGQEDIPDAERRLLLQSFVRKG